MAAQLAQGSGSSTASLKQKDSQQPPQIFEFTKRKRWADLLITELSEAIILILSGTCHVWYCGTAVEDLLGWKDEELVDGDFLDFMNADDRAGFRTSFNSCIQNQTELLSYARLLCKTLSPSPHYSLQHGAASGDYANPASTSTLKEVLFEIKGYPHFLPETQEFKCFFATAKPYPSRNTAMLNTFLELKMENERLQDRLNTLRSKQQHSSTSVSPSGTGSSHAGSKTDLGTASSTTSTSTTGLSISMSMPMSMNASMPMSTLPRMPSSISVPSYSLQPHAHHPYDQPQAQAMSYYGSTSSGSGGGVYDDMLPSPVSARGFESAGAGVNALYGATAGSNVSGNSGGGEEEAGDQSLPRKKIKKVYTMDQYVCVTCGRTDSPEWRKGPLGPKTLCNACGLRWAKRQRKLGEDVEGETSNCGSASIASADIPAPGRAQPQPAAQKQKQTQHAGTSSLAGGLGY